MKYRTPSEKTCTSFLDNLKDIPNAKKENEKMKSILRNVFPCLQKYAQSLPHSLLYSLSELGEISGLEEFRKFKNMKRK